MDWGNRRLWQEIVNEVLGSEEMGEKWLRKLEELRGSGDGEGMIGWKVKVNVRMRMSENW